MSEIENCENCGRARKVPESIVKWKCLRCGEWNEIFKDEEE